MGQPNALRRRNSSDQQLLLWANVIICTVAVGLISGYRLGGRFQNGNDQDAAVSTRIYAVGDILAESENEKLALWDLVGHIHTSIEPSTWNVPGHKLMGIAQQRSIVVQHTDEVHARIGQLLDRVRSEFRQAKQQLDPIHYSPPSELVCDSEKVACLT